MLKRLFVFLSLALLAAGCGGGGGGHDQPFALVVVQVSETSQRGATGFAVYEAFRASSGAGTFTARDGLVYRLGQTLATGDFTVAPGRASAPIRFDLPDGQGIYAAVTVYFSNNTQDTWVLPVTESRDGSTVLVTAVAPATNPGPDPDPDPDPPVDELPPPYSANAILIVNDTSMTIKAGTNGNPDTASARISAAAYNSGKTYHVWFVGPVGPDALPWTGDQFGSVGVIHDLSVSSSSTIPIPNQEWEVTVYFRDDGKKIVVPFNPDYLVYTDDVWTYYVVLKDEDRVPMEAGD